MSLWKKIKGEFVDVIEWINDDRETMVYRFERYGNEIKYGASLIVREGQVAVFVHEGQIADLFEPGTYELKTNNLPILTTLQNWHRGFESPFKSEVYFFSTRQFLDLKWGTANPVMMRDEEFGMVRVRAFGNFSIRINNPKAFLTQIVGTNGMFSTDDIHDQLRQLVTSRFSDVLAEFKVPVIDLAGNYETLGKFINEKLQPEFNGYGLEMLNFIISNISLPPEVEKAIDYKTRAGIIGNSDQYLKIQTAEAIGEGKLQDGGAVAAGVGLSAGMQMMHSMQNSSQHANVGMPPPIPQKEFADIFVAVNAQHEGPYTLSTINAKVRTGEVKPDTMLWRNDMPEWIYARDFPGIIWQTTPPPIPPRA